MQRVNLLRILFPNEQRSKSGRLRGGRHTKGDEGGGEGGGEGKEREIPFPSHLDLLFQGLGVRE